MTYSGIPPAGDRRTWTGYPVGYRPTSLRTSWRRIVKTISAFVMLTFVAQIALSIVTLLYGIQFVAPAILDEWSGFGLFLVLPIIITIVTISGFSLLAYYFFLIGAITASCVWVFITSIDGFSKELSMKGKSRLHSPLFDTVGLMFATIFFSLLVALLANPSSGEVPEAGTLAENLFLLANASVWEELVVRVLLIGIPIMVIDVVRRKRQPKLYSYFLGGGFKMGTPEVVLILASSIVFGYAHFASGWGAWKIVPATVGGIAFGYLFLKFGLAASILLHFGTDYLSMPTQVFDNIGLTLLTGVGILMWVAFGFIFLIYYLTRIGEFLSRRTAAEPTAASPAPQAAPDPGQWTYRPVYGTEQVYNQPPPPAAPTTVFGGGYVCPQCGSLQARWVDGKFQCLRCGRLS